MLRKKPTEFQSHLYGIERRNFYRWKEDEYTFQSHLYGIESGQNKGWHSGDGVSIAPLWNWKTVEGGDYQACKGFNRTFMELKERCGHHRQRWRGEFQSHLYGIERVALRRTRNGAKGFNRTFMELKVPIQLRKVCTFGFQSHLYGIERRVHQTGANVQPCFNRTFMELKA